MKLSVSKPCTSFRKMMNYQDSERFYHPRESDAIGITTSTGNKKSTTRIVLIILGILTALKFFSQNVSRDECGKISHQIIERGCRPTFEIEGMVIDSHNNEPIAFAIVYFTRDNNATITDLDGKFKLIIEPVKNLNDSIKIRFIGYRDTIIPAKSLVQMNGIQKTIISLEIETQSVTMCGVIVVKKEPYHKKFTRKIIRLFTRKKTNETDEL